MVWRLSLAFLMVLFAVAKGAQILLNGEVTNRTEFCAGESLTLVCRNEVGQDAYSWTIPGTNIGPNDLQVANGTRTANMDGFSSVFISRNEARLMFTAVEFLRSETIICRDSLNNLNTEMFTISLHGLPEAPNITFNRSSDKSYFSISITPTDPAAVCVQQYNLTFINETGSVLQYNVSANDATFDSRSVSFADLGTCIATLDLQVVAILGGGVASQNDIMLFTATDSRITATLTGDNVTLTVPDILQSCITNYTYSFQGATGNIEASVENIMLSTFILEPCNAPALTINPIILKVARESAGASVDICVPEVNTSPDVTPGAPVTELTTDSSATPLSSAVLGFLVLSLLYHLLLA